MFRQALSLFIDIAQSVLLLVKGSTGFSQFNSTHAIAGGSDVELPASNQRISTYIHPYDTESDVFVMFLDNPTKMAIYAKLTNYPLKLTYAEYGELMYGRILISITFGGDATVIDRIKTSR